MGKLKPCKVMDENYVFEYHALQNIYEKVSQRVFSW